MWIKNCWGGGDHIDLWDGTKYSGVGEFKYWGKYDDDSDGDGGDIDFYPRNKPCPVYFLEF